MKTKEEILKASPIEFDRLQEEKPMLVHNILKAMEAYASQIPTQEVGVSEGDLIGFGNSCWWESKRYWEKHPDGEATAKTIKSILHEEHKQLLQSLPTPKREDAEICSCGHNLCYLNKGKLYCNKCGGLIEYGTYS